jgi:hypothetical protein
VAHTVDLRRLTARALGRPELRRSGLPALVREVMGVRMEKPHHVRVSAWDKRKLTEDQFKYACAAAPTRSCPWKSPGGVVIWALFRW